MSGPDHRNQLVVVRGGGEMASAAARLLFLSGFPVAVLELEQPLAVRRQVSFAEAVLAGAADVEGVPGRRVDPDQVSSVARARAISFPWSWIPRGRRSRRCGPPSWSTGAWPSGTSAPPGPTRAW